MRVYLFIGERLVEMEDDLWEDALILFTALAAAASLDGKPMSNYHQPSKKKKRKIKTKEAMCSLLFDINAKSMITWKVLRKPIYF